MSAPLPLTAAQIRQACAFLRWKAPMLSRRAGVSYDAAMAALPFMNVWAIHTTLERPAMQLRKVDG